MGRLRHEYGWGHDPVVEKVELRYYLEDDTAEVRVHHLAPHQDALTPAKPQLPKKFLKRGPVAKVNGAESLGAVGRPALNLVGLREARAHLKDQRPQVNNQVPVGYEYLQKDIGMHQTPRITPLDPRWLEEPPRDPLHPLPTTVTTIVGGYHARDIRDGYEGTILRFVTDKEKDREREFVINFYVFDSTVSVFEFPRLNSGIPDLMSGLRGRDIEAKGVLPASDLRAAVVATRLPFPTALTDALVESFKREDGMIDYAHFCHELDYRIRPNIHDHIPCQLDEASLEVALRRLEDKVDYINLVADLEGSANSHHFAGSGVV
ncbi:uncharacterized protein [Macrobrachium rosenbergii]|uniref:uncharacterized protein n=1 Tax=Macrobrachium rosenbergii TaxID=79674 RepID=UPI0034D461DF